MGWVPGVERTGWGTRTPKVTTKMEIVEEVVPEQERKAWKGFMDTLNSEMKSWTVGSIIALGRVLALLGAMPPRL